MKTQFRTKRIYDPPEKNDGYRILVDRLWPRGISKQSARLDLWAKEFAPSANLRKWFHANPNRFDEFSEKYRKELQANRREVAALLKPIRKPVLTLLTATKNLEEGHAAILLRFLRKLKPSE